MRLRVGAVVAAAAVLRQSVPGLRTAIVCGAALAMTAASGSGTPAQEPAPSGPKARLTLERLYSLPNLIGTAPSGFAWSGDGSHLAFLWNEQGEPFRDVYVLHVADPDAVPVRVTRFPRRVLRADPADAVMTAADQAAIERDRGVASVVWRPDGGGLVATFRGDLWGIALGQEPHALTTTPARESQPSFSPDGSRLGFLRDGDLWALPTDRPGAPVRITRLGGGTAQVTSYRWSSDGRNLALFESDVAQVPTRGIPDYLNDRTRIVEVPRAYPGEAPARQRVGIVAANARRVGSAGVAWVHLVPGPDGGHVPKLILGYAWAPTDNSLAIDTSDLYAKNRRIFVVEVGQTAPEGDIPTQVNLVVHERMPLNETFYFWRIAWSVDGQQLYFLSDREQDYHVWALSREGGGARALTSGAWAVASMHPVEGGLVVVGNREHPEQRHLYQVSNAGGDAVRLSHRPGTHTPVISPDGQRAAVRFSSDGRPPDLWLTDLGGGAAVDAGGVEDRERQVTHSPVPEFDEYRWVTPEYVTFPSHVDGSTLHGRLTLPPDFDPNRRYPAILGSVYTDAVRNQWGGRTAHPTWGLDQYLAQEGYILLNVDVRGSWGRGKEHRRGIRLDYGGMDIEDLESGVRFLETLGHVDMDRVGIWGSSYGGLMTAMSLFRKPGLYAAGIAGAPATNVWHALTGQMAVMMAPEDSPDEYADSSPYLHTEGLDDPLMIIHGMRDRIVLYKDSLILVQRLLLLGKDVDLVTLPDAGHGWDNEYLAQTRFAFHKMVQFFDRHLKGVDP